MLKTLLGFLKVSCLTVKYISLISIFFILVFCAYAYTLSAEYPGHAGMTQEKKQQIVQSAITEKRFLDLFEKAPYIGQERYKNVYNIDDFVSAYLSSCCQNKAAALELLKNNGFSIRQFSKGNLPKDRLDIDYDEVISGVRRGKAISLLMYMSYEIVVYVKDGWIMNVQAKVRPNGL